jgi:hypothetical protein
MPMNRLILALFCLLPALPAFAKGPAQSLPNWPCDTPVSGRLEPGMLWPGAAAQPADALHDDAAAQQLADFLAASENSPGRGEREIASFAEKNGPVKTDRALRIVSGVIDRGNVLRGILLDGIKEQVARSHMLADAIAADNAKIAAAESDDSSSGGLGDMMNGQQQPAAPPPAAVLKETLRQHVSQLESADDIAEGLCRRLVFDERKLRRLITALKARTQ